MQTMISAPPLTQTILHWFHVEGVEGSEAHCLARLYRQGDHAITIACAKGIVVLSKIRSNGRHQALMLVLAGAANALIPIF